MNELTGSFLEKFAIVELIEQTDRFVHYTFLWASWFKDRRPDDALLYANEQHESFATINEGLLSVGGLRLSIEDPDGRHISELLLGTWLGRDPDSPGKHLWKPVGAAAEGPYFSITASALTEIRDKLLDEFDPDV